MDGMDDQRDDPRLFEIPDPTPKAEQPLLEQPWPADDSEQLSLLDLEGAR